MVGRNDVDTDSEGGCGGNGNGDGDGDRVVGVIGGKGGGIGNERIDMVAQRMNEPG